MASAATEVHAWEISSIKAFAESNGGTVLPSTYHSVTEGHDDVAEELTGSIPVVDLSLLNSDDPEIHAKGVHELGKACAEWGFFMLTNHGIPETLMEELMEKALEFFYLPEEEKTEFDDKGKSPYTPIRSGTSFSSLAEKVHYWRDYLKVITSPEFSFPNKPPGYRDLAFEFTRKIGAAVRKLVEGISESLGLESDTIIESTDYDSGFQILAVNFYPPCPEPELAQGLPPHSDQGFTTVVMQNGIGGLQVKHDGKWVNVSPVPNSLAVVMGDQLEVLSNGRYRSVIHRAILNNRETRMSLVVSNGPALDKEIAPMAELLSENEKALFKKYKYRDYFHFQQKTRFADKSSLDAVRLDVQ